VTESNKGKYVSLETAKTGTKPLINFIHQAVDKYNETNTGK